MKAASRILLVEDSDTQAVIIQALIKKQGLEAVRVATAEEALERLPLVQPDLMVVDFHLPGMDGDGLCRHVRMGLDTCDIPILMLTSDERAGSEQHALDSGADDFIAKSENPEILLWRICLLLGKARQHGDMAPYGLADFCRPKLLLIDDSPLYCRFLARGMGHEGYDVKTAIHSEEGLGLAATESFDCVLVDAGMPQMDGFEVCRRLIAARGTADGPIVVLLTGVDKKADIVRGMEVGIDDFVERAAALAVLKSRVWALLRRKFYQEQQRRILDEFKTRELATLRAQAEKEAAQAKAALAEKLEAANRKLKAAQSQLVQSEKMSSLGQLVAGVAHEINNPLSFVLNNVYTVERNLRRVLEDEAQSLSAEGGQRLDKAGRRLVDMRQGLERVEDLVRKLRTFSRLDEGEFKEVDIHESLEAVLLFLRHKMEGRIEVKREYAAEGALACCAGQLNQVFMNLIANAVDAIDGPGWIAVATSRDADAFRVSIKDSGPGIPDSVKGRIFEPFFTTKAVGQGTGLGLSISYGIVQAHKGRIDVFSEAGQGTEFVVEIPADHAA